MARDSRLGAHFRGWLKAVGLGVGIAMLVGRVALAGAPYSESELRAVESSDEAKIRSLRKDEVTQLRIALGRRSPANRRADLYLRLAELHIESYRADYLLEGRAHEKRLERGEPDKTIDHSRSRPALSQAIQACKEILSIGIRHPKLDQVYYFLGFNYSELGDRAQGVKYFDQLTRLYPSSPFVGEAYKELGDSAFDAGDFRKAQGHYELANRRADANTRPRILHKLAWSYYRTRQHERAVDTMKQAVTSARESGEKFLSLREEALRDMAVFMTESGRVEEAIRYFQEVADDKAFYPKVLERLGKQYERNVEPAKATQVYESLLKTNPDSEAGFRVRVKLVDLDLRRGRYREALARVQGVELPKGGENDTQVASQNLRAMVRRTATEHHESFRKKGARPELDIAESYYSAYLNTFLAQDDPRGETAEIRMYLAEVKRELGKSKEASELYRSVVDSKDKRYAKEAGALWTASLSEAIRKQAQAAKPAAGAPRAAEPSALEKEFVDAADRLAEALGDTNEGRESALRAAEVLAGYKGTHDDALDRARALIKKSPRSIQAVTAGRLLVQQTAADAEGKADEGALKDTMRQLRENEALMAFDAEHGGKLKAVLADQDTRLKIGVIASNEKSNDFLSAARNYEAFANEATDRALAEKAYANAISSYLKAGGEESAAAVTRVAARWTTRYARSPKAIESLRGAATHSLLSGRFEQTADLFERLGKQAGDADSLETAARIHEGLGASLKAQQLWVSHLESHKDHPHRGSIALQLARSQDAARQDPQAVAAYKSCMAASPALEAECGARLADLYVRNQDMGQAKALYKRVAALGGGPAPEARKGKAGRKAKSAKTGTAPASSGSSYVGYARYRLAEMLESEARFDKLEMPEASLKKALGQRLEFLEPLSRAYLSAVEAGGPWAVAALARLANWATQFAADVDGIAPPAGADADAVARFRKGLEGVSGPLRRKAVDTRSQGYSKALENEILSPVLPELADRLADSRVPIPGRAQGPRGKLRLAGVPADGGEAGKAAAMEKTRERLLKSAQDAPAWVDYGNLLWGEGKPGLARMAYERALGLSPKSAPALNNLAVVLLSTEGEESWAAAAEGNALLREALKQDEFFLPAKMNRASLLNYYRLFAKAKPLWDQVLVKSQSADAHDGAGVAQQGLGQGQAAAASFARAREAGAPKARFAALYHDAARLAASGGEDGASDCLDRLEDLSAAEVAGFEKEAAQRLRNACSQAKNEAKK